MVTISVLQLLDFSLQGSGASLEGETLLNNYVFQANKFGIGYDLVCC
jgi:hypothetical protein